MKIASSIVAGVLILNPGSPGAKRIQRGYPLNQLFALQEKAPPKKHSVTLNWRPSPASVAGYNVYRSTENKNSFQKINKSLVSECKYIDADVESGKTYRYLVRSADGRGHESTNSIEISVVVP